MLKVLRDQHPYVNRPGERERFEDMRLYVFLENVTKKKKRNVIFNELLSLPCARSEKKTHLLRQMLKMWLMMWRCSDLCMGLHEMVSIEIASLSEWLREDIVNLTLRR